MQVIVLGSGGGPVEDNVTGLLVRSTSTAWSKGSVLAVDAGVHMSAIARIMEEHLPSFGSVPDPATPFGVSGVLSPSDMPRRRGRGRARARVENGLRSAPSRPARSLRPRPSRLDLPRESAAKDSDRDEMAARRKSSGASSAAATASYGTVLAGPFSGLRLPSASARVNAGYVTRELVSTYLVTHAHLDHIAGFVVNTAALTQTARPKRLAALTPTIDVIKKHIFNDLIWPNMSDEEGGIGLVTYMRLAEGGDVAIGEGDGRGYIEVCEGLGVKSWTISHGVRMNASRRLQRRHSARGRARSSGADPSGYIGGGGAGGHDDDDDRQLSARSCVYDSTAYFIRDDATGKEVLIFGDVEPDSISWNPRTAHVWIEAAPKIVAGKLGAIFIECSYDDSQSDETLFGHLAPRHLIRELRFLADKVREVRREVRRQRGGGDGGSLTCQSVAPGGLQRKASRPLSRVGDKERRSSVKRKRKRGGATAMVEDPSDELAQQQQTRGRRPTRQSTQQDSSAHNNHQQQPQQPQSQSLNEQHHPYQNNVTATSTLKSSSTFHGSSPTQHDASGVQPSSAAAATPYHISTGTRHDEAREDDKDAMMIDSDVVPRAKHAPSQTLAQQQSMQHAPEATGHHVLSSPLPRPSTVSPHSKRPDDAIRPKDEHDGEEEGEEGDDDDDEILPLRGIKVVVIHVKDPLKDDPSTTAFASSGRGARVFSASAGAGASTSTSAGGGIAGIGGTAAHPSFLTTTRAVGGAAAAGASAGATVSQPGRQTAHSFLPSASIPPSSSSSSSSSGSGEEQDEEEEEEDEMSEMEEREHLPSSSSPSTSSEARVRRNILLQLRAHDRDHSGLGGAVGGPGHGTHGVMSGGGGSGMWSGGFMSGDLMSGGPAGPAGRGGSTRLGCQFIVSRQGSSIFI